MSYLLKPLSPEDKSFFEKLLLILLHHYVQGKVLYDHPGHLSTWSVLLGGHTVTQYDTYAKVYLERQHARDRSTPESELKFFTETIMLILDRQLKCAFNDDYSVNQAANHLRMSHDEVLKLCANGTLWFTLRPLGQLAIDSVAVVSLNSIA
jgi:hypothetical protein